MRRSALILLLLTGCYIAPEDLSSPGGSKKSILPADRSGGDAGLPQSEAEGCDAGVVNDAGDPYAWMDGGDSDAGVAGGDAGVVTGSCDPAEAPAVIGQIPGGLHESAVFWDGQQVILLGGMTSAHAFSDVIWRFDPVTHAIAMTGMHLPAPKQSAAIASSGTRAWLIGGKTAETTFSSEIVAFDSSTMQATTLPVFLPTPRYNAAAVWANGKIFIFGGYDGTQLRQVLKFDLSTNSVTPIAAQMPEGREAPVAAFTGTDILVAGGWTGYGTASSILRFDPASESFLPEIAVSDLRSFAAGAYAGGQLFLLGGTWPSGASNAIGKIDTATNTTATLASQLPIARVGQSAVVAGCHVYAFGGSDASGTPLSAIQSVPVSAP